MPTKWHRQDGGAALYTAAFSDRVAGGVRDYPVYIVICGACLAGCAQQQQPRWAETPQVLAEVAAAQQRPVELPDAQKRQVIGALAGSTGAAARFADPELERQVFASFWRSPLTNQVDPNRLLLVRYFDDGRYVYVGFDRDGRLFTDGLGNLFADPPWAQ